MTSKEYRLWDTQWISVVNHDKCYEGYSKEDAIAKAVQLTENYMAWNANENKWPPNRQEHTA